ncbi:hypothetical protein RJ641_000795 [Dillenia turbinata]|uniref:Uncharacterized protein n=1 Tax=Dillenia turbinata TaxID=194707 RepID=A0AAN8WJI3_9MAGN
MLTCISCSKQMEEGGDEEGRGTPSTKEAVKSLTAQTDTDTLDMLNAALERYDTDCSVCFIDLS